MILPFLLAIPIAGGVLSLALGKVDERAPRWVSLAAMSAVTALSLGIWAAPSPGGPWLQEESWRWIPELGIGIHLAVDGLSLLLVALTGFLGIMAAASSWTEIRQRQGFFHFNLLWCLAGVVGVFISLDLFLFYFLWELMLVPMYFLIAIWGHENRHYASVKFFIFTQLSGLLMLAAILGLYFVHGSGTGLYTFDYTELLGTLVSPSVAPWLLAGFIAAFLVKLPAFLLHTWLPDAHTEAPTAGSIVLAGLLLKTGAYGLIRFAVPLFPDAAAAFAPYLMALAVAGIIYGAVLAFAQTDLKRLVAYTSVSHMGFVLLGVAVWNELSLQGATVEIVAHGISTGSLFFLVGALQERTGTRDMARMGGLWSEVPRMGGVWLLFALASLGLPGLGNFIGEFLVLFGTYRVSVAATAVAAAGFVAAVVYALWMVQRAFFGQKAEEWKIKDLSARETAVMAAMIAAILWIGLYPRPVIDTAGQGIENVRRYAGALTSSGPAGMAAADERIETGGIHDGQ
jgi:NADH-quinone oxidoreductase subunit M